MEFCPLTPERASSTLSRMSCEKLHSTPGKFSSNVFDKSAINSALVRGRPRLGSTGHSC